MILNLGDIPFDSIWLCRTTGLIRRYPYHFKTGLYIILTQDYDQFFIKISGINGWPVVLSERPGLLG